MRSSDDDSPDESAGDQLTRRPMGPDVDVSASLVNRNGKTLSLNCIQSILDATREVSLEIILVDNASTDESVAAVRENYPGVRIVQNQTPRGYGASHNMAFRISRGRYFLAMNNDMLVLPGAIDALHRRILSDSRIGALGCRLLNADGSVQRSCAPEGSLLRVMVSDLLPTGFPLARRFLDEWYSDWPHDTERDVGALQGSCLLIPREVMERIGLFDERFDFYSEEFDICKRIRDAGFKVSFTPAGEMVHLDGQTAKWMSAQAMRFFIESRYKYFDKHSGRFAAAMTTLASLLRAVSRWMGYELLALVPGDRRAGRRRKARTFLHLLPWFFERDRPWRRGPGHADN